MKKNLITKKELLKATGITNSALGVYLKKGLIPYPKVISNYQGKRGRTGLYFEWVIDRVKKIKDLTSQGYTLDAIKPEFSSGKSCKENRKLKSQLSEIISGKLRKDILSKEEIDGIAEMVKMGWTMHTVSEAQQINMILENSKDE